jgi:LPS O-antigen subunit length determinant protein (WzzB/FepE family)
MGNDIKLKNRQGHSGDIDISKLAQLYSENKKVALSIVFIAVAVGLVYSLVAKSVYVSDLSIELCTYDNKVVIDARNEVKRLKMLWEKGETLVSDLEGDRIDSIEAIGGNLIKIKAYNTSILESERKLKIISEAIMSYCDDKLMLKISLSEQTIKNNIAIINNYKLYKDMIYKNINNIDKVINKGIGLSDILSGIRGVLESTSVLGGYMNSNTHLQHIIDHAVKSKILSPVSSSVSPVKPKRLLIVLLSFLAGCLVSIFYLMLIHARIIQGNKISSL